MLKNKLVEQILSERYYILEQSQDTGTPPLLTDPNQPKEDDSMLGNVLEWGTDQLVDIALKTGIALPTLLSLPRDIKRFFLDAYNPSKSHSDVLISKIPSMISPENLKTPRIQRVKDFGSAEGKKIAS
jgi:hypothetical protein